MIETEAALQGTKNLHKGNRSSQVMTVIIAVELPLTTRPETMGSQFPLATSVSDTCPSHDLCFLILQKSQRSHHYLED